MQGIQPATGMAASEEPDGQVSVVANLSGLEVTSGREVPAGQLSAVEQLRESEQRLGHFLDTAADRLWEMNADLRIVYVSQGKRDTMLAQELILGKTRWELAGVAPDVDAKWRAHVEDLRARRPFRDFEFEIAGADGKVHYHSVSGIPLFDRKGTFVGYRGTVRDVTALREAHQRIEHLAFHDDLTGLPNRRYLNHELKRLVGPGGRSGVRLGMMLLDIDYFKDINDTLGHSMGDKLLIEVAQRLRQIVGERDILARIGGDEFAIIAVSAWDREQLVAMAELIIQVMAEPFRIDTVGFRIGVSIGVTVYPDHSTDFERTFANADIALYAAKNAGRHTWHMFDDELHEQVQSRHLLDQELRRAWQFSEFALHYQPLVCASSATVMGFEALLRWQHRQRGCLLPSSFLTALERSPIMEPLTRWALRKALRERQRWFEGGIGTFKIAVNIPSAALRSANLIDTVIGCLEETGTLPEVLTLEISEEALIDELAAVPVLEALRAKGVIIAIDDFGIGYSSLSRLKSLPIDVLKIDRSFLANAAKDGEEAVILEMMIKMGRSLGKKVVVEGVETKQQVAFLDRIGCDELQGFLFTPALPPTEIARWITGWHSVSNKPYRPYGQAPGLAS